MLIYYIPLLDANFIRSKWAQAREAFNPLQDPQGWLLFLAVFGLSICNGGLGNYFHLILVAYGFGSLDSILLGLPTAVLQIIGVLAVGFVAEHVSNSRCESPISLRVKGRL